MIVSPGSFLREKKDKARGTVAPAIISSLYVKIFYMISEGTCACHR
jgi:hypothetical protein